jgi:hypothetical protein
VAGAPARAGLRFKLPCSGLYRISLLFPMKRWQKMAAFGAVFGTLFTRAQPAPLAALILSPTFAPKHPGF